MANARARPRRRELLARPRFRRRGTIARGGWHGGRRRAGDGRHRLDPRLAPRAGAGEAGLARARRGHRAPGHLRFDAARVLRDRRHRVRRVAPRRRDASGRMASPASTPSRSSASAKSIACTAPPHRFAGRCASGTSASPSRDYSPPRSGLSAAPAPGRPTRSGRDSRWASFPASPEPSSFPRCSTSSRRSSRRSLT